MFSAGMGKTVYARQIVGKNNNIKQLCVYDPNIVIGNKTDNIKTIDVLTTGIKNLIICETNYVGNDNENKKPTKGEKTKK